MNYIVYLRINFIITRVWHYGKIVIALTLESSDVIVPEIK